MMFLRSSPEQAALDLYYGEDSRKHAFQNWVESAEELLWVLAQLPRNEDRLTRGILWKTAIFTKP